MALQIYSGVSGSGKTHSLFEHIINESIAHPELNYIVLVPEQYTLTTQYKLVQMHPRHGILNIDVLNFNRLAHRIFEEVGYNEARGTIIDDIGKNLILRHLAGQNEDRLTALSGVFRKLGYISEVKSVISEFMQYGIGDEQLATLIDNSKDRGILHAKLSDIRILYAEFLKLIDDRYVAAEELLQKARDAVSQSNKLKSSVVVLDGYTGYTPVQLDIIGELLKNCVDVYVTVLMDNNCETQSEQDLFYMSKTTIAKLDRLCRDNEVPRKEDVVCDSTIPARFRYDMDGNELAENCVRRDLVHLEKNLFRGEDPAYIRKDSDDSIHIFTGTNPREEAIETAVRIKKLICEQGYHYKDIAVVSGDIATYSNACQRAFMMYDIPYFIDKTRPVLLNPMIEYIRAIFDVITEDYSYESVFRYLRSDILQLDREEIDQLENYVLMYGIKGHNQWGNVFVRKPESMDASELVRLNEIRTEFMHDFELLMEELSGNIKSDSGKYTKKTEVSVKALSTALYYFIKRQELSAKMDSMAEEFSQTGDMARAREYSQIYEEVMNLLDKMVELLPGEVVTIAEYAELLDAGFAEIRTGVIPANNDYVQVGDITRTRLRDIKALFFMGVNDGIIPMNNSGSGIISDMEREFLVDNEDNIEMAPTVRSQSYTQRLYLYMLVTRPSENLYISYSKIDEDGKSINPSYFVKTIKKLFPKLVTEVSDDGLDNRVYNLKSGYYELASKMQEAISNSPLVDRGQFMSLFSIYSGNEEYRKKTERLIKEAFSFEILKRNDEISRAVANVLYGNVLTCSVTRLENYARCAYSHFLKYGLSLKERELFSFESRDVGSIFHDTLQSYAGLIKERNLSWFDISTEESELLIDEAINRCIGKEDYSALYGTFRTKYMINRMKRITRRTVDTLTRQLRKGSFIPYEFEFSFSSANDYKSLNIALSDDERIRLMGRIDRMDICEDERNVYVKVIDYKSGNKSFDLAAIYMGLDLQLVVYMNAAMETMALKNEYTHSDKTIVPAGILYYHIDDPIIDAGNVKSLDDESINDSISKELKMRGLVNSDEKVYRLMDSDFETRSSVIPVSVKKDGDFNRGSSVASTEEFKVLSDYVNLKISEMGREILAGDIKIEPHKKKEGDNPCRYCDYMNVCGYRGDGVTGDDEYTYDDADYGSENYETTDTNDVISKMRDRLRQ